MSTAINLLREAKLHYTLFGFEGLRFFYQKRRAKQAIIAITPPGYRQPIYLRNGTTDLQMFYYAFQIKHFEFDCSQPPEIILDCGAHIGLSAVFYAHKYPFAKVICIEPEQSNFDMLRKNTASYPNVIVLQNGIWSKTTNLRIIDMNTGHWGFKTEETDEVEEGTVPAISLDEIMTRYKLEKIDICKINVEGTEKEVFEENYANWLPKTKVILIELHDHLREGCSKAFFTALKDFDYAVTPQYFFLLVRLIKPI